MEYSAATEILEKLANPQQVDPDYKSFGDGHSAERIMEMMEKHRR